MTCPTCGERLWRYDPTTWTCRNGHRHDGPEPSTEPPAPKFPWQHVLPYVGGLAGIVSLVIELLS